MERTGPTILYLVGIVYLWYFEHGKPPLDVSIARSLAPWYRSKTDPAFEDMLGAVRREIISAEDLSSDPLQDWVMEQV